MAVTAMKKWLQGALLRRGYAIKRVTTPGSPRATMDHALAWLARQRFEVDTVLDVGASDGCWSRECARHFPAAQYVLFEPHPAHQDALSTLSGLGRSAPRVVARAVGPHDGITPFAVDSAFGGGLAGSGVEGAIEVPMTTLDSAVSELGCAGPYLVKLDTHGYERGILEGAVKVLGEASVLIIEAYAFRIAPGAMRFWELCAFLDERGFAAIDLVDVMHRKRDHALWQMDLVFVRKDWPGFEDPSYT